MRFRSSNPTEQEVYAGRLAEETNISKTASFTYSKMCIRDSVNGGLAIAVQLDLGEVDDVALLTHDLGELRGICRSILTCLLYTSRCV